MILLTVQHIQFLPFGFYIKILAVCNFKIHVAREEIVVVLAEYHLQRPVR